MGILKEFKDLPAMPATNIPDWNSLKIGGLAGNHLTLDLVRLWSLPRSVIIQDFQCNDGWICRDQEWGGVTVKSLLEKVGWNDEVHNVEFTSGLRQVNLTIDESLDLSVIVALTLNGKAIPSDNGGPCRLLAGHRKGPSHLKWLDNIKLVGHYLTEIE